MGYKAKILLDSVSETNKRITTFEISFPRCVLAEWNTHRAFSRNSASSRAIPIEKMLQKVKDDPFIPEKWGKPARGMGAKEYWPLDSPEHAALTLACREELKQTVEYVEAYKHLANKEDLNRYLEPFLFHTVINTATEYDQFFKLRTNDAADWKIKKIADMMYDLYHEAGETIEKYKNFSNLKQIHNPHTVQFLKTGEWHTPLVYEEDIKPVRDYTDYYSNRDDVAVTEALKKISVARCARVSFLTHDNKRDIEKDLELYERLKTSGHNSPFEHIATPSFRAGYTNFNYRNGNFVGWRQARQDLQDENCTSFRK